MNTFTTVYGEVLMNRFWLIKTIVELICVTTVLCHRRVIICVRSVFFTGWAETQS